IAMLLEPIYHPERGHTLRDTYGIEIAVCALGLVLERFSLRALTTETVAALVCACLSLLMIRYNVLVGGQAERCAMFQVCLLSGLVVLLPWGWRAQLLIASASLGGIVVLDDHRHAFRLAAHVKARPEVAAEVAHIDFAPDGSPLVQAIRPGELLEIEDAQHQPYVPPELLRRWDTASQLCAPVARRGEVIAVMIFAYRTRTGPFSS